MSLTSWRAALLIARRDALRAKGRSALVLAMLTLPVLGAAGIDVVERSSQLTPAERATRMMGTTDATISMFGRGRIVLQEPVAEDGLTTNGPSSNQKPTSEQQRSAGTDPAVLLPQLLPAGSVLLPAGEGPMASARSRDGLLTVETTEADLNDPAWHGMLNVVSGRAPGAADEVAVTQAFLDQAHLAVGDTTSVRGLPGQFRITAAVEYPNDLHRLQLVGRPGALIAPLTAAQRADSSGTNDLRWLVKLPHGAVLDWHAVRELDKYGFATTSRSVVLDPPPSSQVPYDLQYKHDSGSGVNRTEAATVVAVVGMALLEIVLLAGPAFAVGARRSRRQLGLIAAGGGDRSHIRAVVLGGGLVLGLAGAVTGTVAAIGLVVAVRPWLEEAAGQRFGQLSVRPLDLVAVAAIGLVTGLLAAIVPAVQASRQDVVESLSGRGTTRPVSRKLPLLGVAMVAGGAALALLGAVSTRSTVLLGGSAVAELGMVACTPLLIGLFGRLGRSLPLGPRLALRDSVRHRGRTAPAVAAVMAAVAGSVAIGIYTTSSDQESRDKYAANAPAHAVTLAPRGWDPANSDPTQLNQLRSAVEQSMPPLGQRADVDRTTYCPGTGNRHCGTLQVQIPKDRRCPATDEDNTGNFNEALFEQEKLTDPRCSYFDNEHIGDFGDVPAGDATVLHNLFGVQDPAAEKALADGKAVVFDPYYVQNGKITIVLTEPLAASANSRPGSGPPPKPVTHLVSVDAVVVNGSTRSAQALISPDTARRLGLGAVDAGSVWLPATAPSSDAEQKAAGAVGRVTDQAKVTVERGYQSQQTLIGLGLTGFAALVALGAAGIATGLAAADSQQDLATLAAVGAASGIRRRLSGFQCGVIAAMGAVLGTVSGFVPAVALRVLKGSERVNGEAAHTVISVPWLNIGLTLIVLPLLAVGLAMLLTRSRPELVRRAA
ncbi:FtsX-like permease family protein [Kitasatospora sp. NPDC001660]